MMYKYGRIKIKNTTRLYTILWTILYYVICFKICTANPAWFAITLFHFIFNLLALLALYGDDLTTKELLLYQLMISRGDTSFDIKLHILFYPFTIIRLPFLLLFYMFSLIYKQCLPIRKDIINLFKNTDKYISDKID